MDSTLAKFEKLGLSAYESKAMMALLQKHPSIGYQVGKSAGIPISKVYDVLGRLRNKGVVTVDDSVTPARYYPVPVNALIAKLRSGYDTVVHELESDLKLIAPVPEIDPSWNLMGYEAVLKKAAAVLKSASKTAMVSAWKEELERLRPDIRAAQGRGVKVILSAFGVARVNGPLAVPMKSCGKSSRKRLGARLMVIAADSREVLISSVTDAAGTAGIVTSTPQIVRVAKEYVRHDVWSRILIHELGEDRFDQLCRENELVSFLVDNE